MSNNFEFVRLVGDELRVGNTIKSISKHFQNEKECFLFVSPHDDDVVVGGGLMIQAACEENIDVYVLIATDGSMGYCTMEEKDSISEIRQKETFDCYRALGVPKENIIWMGFPDCQVNAYRGRRAAGKNCPAIIEGFTGLQNAFTYYLRDIKPTQCFLPTSSDLHPDHRIVHEEFFISLFHASGDIWPELGEATHNVPFVHEMGVYCDFPQPPNLRIGADEKMLEKKLKGIAAFKSQKQIEALIEIVRKSGPEEYLRAVQFQLYDPTKYRHLFDERNNRTFHS